MLFSKRKKLNEIDKKVDYLIEQLSKQNQRIEQISTMTGRLEERVSEVEKSMGSEMSRLGEGLKLADEHIDSSTEKALSETHEMIRLLKGEMAEVIRLSSGEQKERLEKLEEYIGCTTQELRQQLEKGNETCGKELSSMGDDIGQRFGVLDSSLRLLLLNSVMDQMDGE